ncbi:MAG: type I phosphomannose isomerase catalytic subunit [Aureliella sp.]
MHVPPYPLRLIPAFRNYLWGGRKLATHLGKPIPSEGTWAESWEIVDHAEHESLIANGPLAGQTLGQLMRSDRQWLVGDAPAVAGRFPLLLKYLDCQRVLSVQVHPEDEYALAMNPPDLGKTEAWYIVSAEPGSILYAGLKPGVGRDELRAAIEAGQTAECLHAMEPNVGDCVFIPAGTVHALGSGLIVAEIQQASNTTFRLYDWDRVDDQGKSRPLHIEQSLETIDFSSGPRVWQVPQQLDEPGRERLVECDKFSFDRITGVPQVQLGGDGRFHILTVPEGRAKVRATAGAAPEKLERGESLLLPASLPAVEITLEPGATLLEASI